jgi:hypothetical protein
MIEFRFEPLEQFEWRHELSGQLIGVYYPGMGYNCTKNVRHDSLRKQCETWLAEGKIRVTPLSGTQKFFDVGAPQ